MGQAFNKLAGEHGAGNGEGHSKEAAVAKTAGFFVFSGIAMSILKALNSCNNNDNKLLTHSVTETSQPNDPPHSREPIFKVTQLTHLIWKIFYILYRFLLEFSSVCLCVSLGVLRRKLIVRTRRFGSRRRRLLILWREIHCGVSLENMGYFFCSLSFVMIFLSVCFHDNIFWENVAIKNDCLVFNAGFGFWENVGRVKKRKNNFEF